MTRLHHVLAATASVSDNHHFYTQILGLSWLNPANLSQPATISQLAYGLATANNTQPASLGPVIIYCSYPQAQPKQIGTDTISSILLSVNGQQALQYWQSRLAQHHLWHQFTPDQSNSSRLAFEDPEGQSLVLVNSQDVQKQPQSSVPLPLSAAIPLAYAIQGLYGLEITVPTLEHLHFMLTKVLGFTTTDNPAANDQVYRSVTTYCLDQGGPGRILRVIKDDKLPPVWDIQAGSIQQLALAVASLNDLLAWQAKLDQFNLPHSAIISTATGQSLTFPISPGITLALVYPTPIAA